MMLFSDSLELDCW